MRGQKKGPSALILILKVAKMRAQGMPWGAPPSWGVLPCVWAVLRRQQAGGPNIQHWCCACPSLRGRHLPQLGSQEAQMKSTFHGSSSLGHQNPVLIAFGQLGFWMQSAKIVAKW